MLLLQCCALHKFSLTDGQNACEQITRGRRLKHMWSNCILSVPFILSGNPNECWLHRCNTCVITPSRLRLRAPLVTSKKSLWIWVTWTRSYYWLSSPHWPLWIAVKLGRGKKEGDTQQEPVQWRERERERERERGGSPENESTDQQWWRPWKWSQHNFTSWQQLWQWLLKWSVMWWDKPFFQISIGKYEKKRHHVKFKYTVKWWWWTRDLDNYEQNSWVKWLQWSQWWQ